MPRSQRLLLILGLAAVLLSAGDAEARRPRRRNMAAGDPLAYNPLMDIPSFESPWGPAPYVEYGSFQPAGGTWDELLKSGPTAAVGVRWKYADFSGDLLPPSSTYFVANFRHAFLKGDQDAQIVNPLGGPATDVLNMRLNLAEVSVSQRFTNASRRGLFMDVGAGLGVGVASAKTVLVPVTPGDTQVFETGPDSSGFLMRAEVNSGMGLQFDRFDLRFGLTAGLNGSNALSDSFRSQFDAGARMSATLYLWE